MLAVEDGKACADEASANPDRARKGSGLQVKAIARCRPGETTRRLWPRCVTVNRGQRLPLINYQRNVREDGAGFDFRILGFDN